MSKSSKSNRTPLQKEREKRGWTRDYVAERVGVSAQTVGSWERGEREPFPINRQELCKLFGKNAVELGLDKEESSALEQPEQLYGVSSEVPVEYRGEHPEKLTPDRPKARRRQLRPLLLIASVLVVLSLIGGLIAVFTRSKSPEEIYNSALSGIPAFRSFLAYQDIYEWDTNSECVFERGAYHVLLQSTEYVHMCFAHRIPSLSNFALQVTMKVLHGIPGKSASGGIVFRAENSNANDQNDTVYRIPVDVNGSYNFFLGRNINCSRPSVGPYYCRSPFNAVHRGLDQTNMLTVIALNDIVYFYANGIFIDQASSNLSSSGYIGVFANGNHAATEVVFSDLKIWKL